MVAILKLGTTAENQSFDLTRRCAWVRRVRLVDIRMETSLLPIHFKIKSLLLYKISQSTLSSIDILVICWLYAIHRQWKRAHWVTNLWYSSTVSTVICLDSFQLCRFYLRWASPEICVLEFPFPAPSNVPVELVTLQAHLLFYSPVAMQRQDAAAKPRKLVPHSPRRI